MARSQKDDQPFSDMQHHTWNYRGEAPDSSAPGGLGERAAPPLLSNNPLMSDNMYVNTNSFAANDVYLNKRPYNMNPQMGDGVHKDENIPINNMQNANCQNNLQNYAMVNLNNGQLVRVFYDENNRRLMIPVTGQYELFSPSQGARDLPPPPQPQPPLSHMFTLSQEYLSENIPMPQSAAPTPTTVFGNDHINQATTVPTSNFLKEVLGNWEPNSSGTYSPFGQNYPLNHPDAPAMNLPQSHPVPEPQFQANIAKPEHHSPKRSDPLADTSNKKRIVAEVKPMRPSYSDVLAKNKINAPEPTRKTKVPNVEAKVSNKSNSAKTEKISNVKQVSDDNKQKNDKKLNMTSSGSESGDFANEDMEKRQKPNKKTKNKKSNMPRKWSSLDDITNEEDSYTHSNDSQFVFIENHTEKPTKKDKKYHDKKITDKSANHSEEYKLDDEDSQFVFQESPVEGLKARRKKDSRSYKPPKPVVEKKKPVVSKWRRNKPGYVGLVQGWVERWGGASWKALVWFLYLLSDICRMSAHLTFDLCTSVFTQSYVSGQAVWRSTREYVRKLADNKYLLYLDRKFGHTRFGFWRKLKWFKKEAEADNGDSKLDSNIPLPATGEEAMKRLLACKGKDPYSILGVSVSCTDEQIKRHYRRQAFLVHPDKNPCAGAEEAFKILQHAFDLIGEPRGGSSTSVTDEQIKRHYRRQFLVHPDKNPCAGAEEAFKILQHAFDLIGEPRGGSSTSITDEQIKRHYRRQFLVHPDKNTCAGAEEAFKILQHAFDLIGEPERRESYDRRAVESRHVEAAWGELSQLLAQLHHKMERAANTIRCTNCGRRHKRVLTERPCYAARYCAMCKIRHSAKEGDIWAESSLLGLLVMYYACMDGAVYQITQWASCQKKNLKQLRPDCHLVQYRIVLGNKAAACDPATRPAPGHDPNLEEFLNNLYTKSGVPSGANTKQPTTDTADKKRRNKKPKA
ncbi:unnamed protein product [Plutella xylostella]|uniref:(diamondback moth) hypothetical protein n=1 Tax=Plutella xylostella TaxID=51655 RepID=A0A8S4GF24_PLUXY|nr:unnamed protein product [Plutella xylostella]